MASWISSCKKIVHMDFHMPEFPRDAIRNFDPVSFVAELRRAGVDAVAIFAKDHFGMSFYPTEVGHMHQGLQQDFLGGVLAEAHKHHIKVLAYLSAGWDQYNIRNNPDWKQCGRDGKPLLKDAEWEWGCLNSPYKEESIFAQIREICEKYPVDGFFFDAVMFQRGGCYCRYCQQKFSQMYGYSLLEADERSHQKFMADSILNFAAECMRIIKGYNPDACVCMNSSWELGQDRRLAELVDFLIVESQPAHGVNGYELMSTQGRYTRMLGKPFEITTVRFAEGWGEMTLKETEQLQYEFSLIAAQGGIICCGDQVYPDGTLEPACYDRLKEAFSYVEAKQEGQAGQFVSDAALLCSSGENFPYSVESFPQSFLGTAKCLSQLHILYDIIDSACLSPDMPYRVLIVPDHMRLSASEISLIREYVEKGGSLLCVGNCIWAEKDLWKPLLGVEPMEPFLYPCAYYAKSDLHPMPLLVKSRAVKVHSCGASELAALQLPITVSAPPHRGFRSPYPPAASEKFYPAATMAQYGKGRAVYLAMDVPGTYAQYGHLWLRDIFADLYRILAPDPAIAIEAPAGVEASYLEKDGCGYLHLVASAFNPPSAQSYAPVERIFSPCPVRIIISGKPVRQISVLGSSRRLEGQENSNLTDIRFSLEEIYTVVKLEYETSSRQRFSE